MKEDNEVPQLHCSAGDWHDFIRYLIIHWAQKHGYTVYSEPNLGKFKPDLELRQIRPTPREFIKNAPVVYVEIQKDQSDKWIDDTIKNYRGKVLSIFQPQDFFTDDNFRVIRDEVELQIQNECNAPPDRNYKDSDGDNYIEVNGHYCKKKNAWRYKGR